MLQSFGAITEARTPYRPENIRDFAPKRAEQAGDQSAMCSSHFIKLLFAARLSHPDVKVAITQLASKFSSWNTSHDRALKRLTQYVATKAFDFTARSPQRISLMRSS